MNAFRATLINEIEKLYKKKKVLVAAILSLAFIVLGQISMTALRTAFGLRAVGSMEFPVFVLSVVVNSILPLFTALVSIDSFSGEFSHNTMKIVVIRPVTRLKIMFAKVCAIMIFVITNLVFVMIFSLAAGILFNANSFSFQGLYNIIISYLVTLMPMLVLASIVVLLTNIIKSGTGVFFLSIIIFMVFKALGIVFPKISSLLFTSQLDWYNLWVMDTLPFLKIFRLFMLMASYVIILLTATYYLFDKRDF
jgi:ABC-2 type transport system permease protein